MLEGAPALVDSERLGGGPRGPFSPAIVAVESVGGWATRATPLAADVVGEGKDVESEPLLGFILESGGAVGGTTVAPSVGEVKGGCTLLPPESEEGEDSERSRLEGGGAFLALFTGGSLTTGAGEELLATRESEVAEGFPTKSAAGRSEALTEGC